MGGFALPDFAAEDTAQQCCTPNGVERVAVVPHVLRVD